MKEKNSKKAQSICVWKRFLAGILSMAMIFTSLDITALAYQEEKQDYVSVTDDEGNEVIREDESWEEQFPNGTFAFKNEYVTIQESTQPKAQKITLYRLGGTAGEATARIAVSPVISYLDEEGTQPIYANAAGSGDYTLEAEDPLAASGNGETSYSPVNMDQEDPYATNFFDITFADGEWIKDILVMPVNDQEHESEELALLTIYEAEGAEFTEASNRMTIRISDDEEILPSVMGFEEEQIQSDKAEQKAIVRIKREGALQYVTSVNYTTVDGTAKAGQDYIKKEGMATFTGDVDFFDVEVELIDDKQESEADRTFTLLLSEPKGGIIRAGGETLEVVLHNSNTAKNENLATRLQSPDAVDLTAQMATDEKAVTEHENQVITEVDESLNETIKGKYTPEGSQNPRLRSLESTGTPLDFGTNKGSWSSEETDPDKVGNYGNLYGELNKKSDGMKLSSEEDAYMRLHLRGIHNRFWKLHWEVECATRKDKHGAYNYLSATYGALANNSFLNIDNGDTDDTGSTAMEKYLVNKEKNDSRYIYGGRYLFCYSGEQANGAGTGGNGGDINITSPDYEYLIMKIKVTNDDGDIKPVYGSIDLRNLRLYRNTIGQNPTVQVITPDSDDDLKSRLDQVQPEISLASGNEGDGSGTDKNGKLFMGSKLKIVQNPNSGNYTLAKATLTGSNADHTLWTAEPSNPYLELSDQKNIGSKLNANAGDYKIRTWLNRNQKIDIYYGASILESDEDAVIESKKNKILKNVTYQYKSFNGDSLQYEDKQGALNRDGLDEQSQTFTTKEALQNVKSMNFHMDDGSLILYHNAAYAGDADIPIASEDYQKASVTFQVYTADSISVEREPKIIAINNIALYEDKNENGSYDAGEKKLQDITEEEMCMDSFRKADGHPLCFRFDYTIQPSCLEIPQGRTGNETFLIVPSFVNTLTEESVKEKLTPEMKEYRDITCRDGSMKMYGKTTDGKLSAPVGYDASPASFDDKKKVFVWNPQWKGNLAKPYENPQKIVLDGTWMPDGFEAAVGKDAINQYLGCLQGNDTVVLSSRTAYGISGIKGAFFSTYPEPGAQSFDQVPTPNSSAPQDQSGTTANMPDAAATSPSVELPALEIGVGPLKYIMGQDEIGFSVGVPLYENESQNTGNKSEPSAGAATKEEKEAEQKRLDDAKAAYNSSSVFQKLRERSKRGQEGDNPGFEGGDMKGKSDALSFGIAMNATFMWKYNKKTASYEFSSAMMAVAVSGSVRLQYRFSACPIFYVYLAMGGELGMSTGLEVEVDVDDKGEKTNEVKFAGLMLAPSVFIEAGAGVGIDIAKLEVYVKVTVSMAMTMGKGEDAFSFDKFETGAAVGFNVVFLLFSFKMDVVGCTTGYDKELQSNGNNGWFFKWSVFGKEMKRAMRSRMENTPEVAGANVSVELPKNTSDTQRFYTSDDNELKEIMPFAFDLDGVPFQSSGYGSSVAAIKLADGLDAATDYKLLTVGEKNYVLFMISRKNPVRDTDSSQLVLSELTTVSRDGQEVMGLANPVEPDAKVPYIVVDQKENGKEDPNGDLEFDAYVNAGKIWVTWTSYEDDYYNNVESYMTPEEILAEVSKHICVKTSSVTPGSGQKFEAAGIVTVQNGDSKAGYRFIPKAVNENVFFYAEGEPYSKEALDQKKEEYKKYYEQASNGNETDGTGGTGDPYANANYKYSVTMDELYGNYSKLNFAVKQEDGTFQNVTVECTKEWKDHQTRIDYIRLIDAGKDEFYLAYATSESKLVPASDSVPQDDLQTVKKLYLQKAEKEESMDAEGTIVSKLRFGAPALIKTLVDSDMDDSLDGEYQEGALVQACTAPSFNNLNFLKGKLKAESDAEPFFLFGMNGMTYVVDQKNLEDISSGRPGTITPFFQTEEKGNSEMDTVIGADGDGNISAVYTDTVPNTVNNALYLTKYDPAIGTFGEGIMLAMNHMQVYEDSQAGNWDAQETQDAYYDWDKGGGMNKFSFQKPQIALGTPTTEEKQGTLTIVTQGTYTDLVKSSFQKPETGESVSEVIPDPEGGISGQLGVYALTYGIGKQHIGEEAIRFDREEFVPGAKLDAKVSFRNTGDVAIRASEDNPAFVRLLAAKDGKTEVVELAGWKILTNVLSGQEVLTESTQTMELPADIHKRILYFEVSEDADYITEGAFLADTFDNEEGRGRIQVGSKPEVLVSELSLRAGSDMARENINGEDSVCVDVDLLLENKGVKDAENIRLQVERSDGKDENLENKYVRMKSSQALVTAGGEALTGAGTDGIYRVTKRINEQNGKPEACTGIVKGGSMRLKGKIVLPISGFDLISPNEGLNLKLTVLTDSKEYTEKNNVVYESFNPVTKFQVPASLNLTIGNTVYFPLSYVAASAKNSNISASEMTIGSMGTAQEASSDSRLLDVLSYNRANGMVAVRAEKLGSGIIRISDTTTNSYEDIVFVNTGDGVNISIDNQALDFSNSSEGKWKDVGIGRITDDAVLPYNMDVCEGYKGGSFTFTTYASSIDLYFHGKAEVTSKNAFGFGGTIVEGSGKSAGQDYFQPVTVDFQNNKLQKHEVTITVLGNKAQMDKMVEHYGDGGDVSQILEKDEQPPKIIFGKQAPAENRLQKGTVFEMPVYIYDNVAISSVSIDGGGADEYLHQGFARSVLRITENRTYRIIALDSYGNRTTSNLEVNWFEEGVAGEEKTDEWPDVTVEAVDEKGEAIPEFTNGAGYIRYQAEASANISTIKIYEYDPETGNTKQLGDTIAPNALQVQDTMKTPLPKNGYYRVEVEDIQNHITNKVFYLNCLSKGLEVNLYKAVNQTGKLFYSVGSEDSEVKLKEMAIYKGAVTQTNPDSIEAGSAVPVLKKDYQGKSTTWDTGTIDLGDSSVYTILAKDVTGKIGRFVYNDNMSLEGLAVHADGFELEMETFSPHKYEYHVLLPYGFPEDRLPAVEYSISKETEDAGVTVTKKEEMDSVTLTLAYQENSMEYRIIFEREVCTCEIDLTAYKNVWIIPSGQETSEEQLNKRVTVSGCQVKGHEGNTEETVKYRYEVQEGQDFAEVSDDGTVTCKNFPKGAVSVSAKIKITAYNDIKSAEAVAECTIYKKYQFHVEAGECGTIYAGEDTEEAFLPDKDGNTIVEEALISGEDYKMNAVADEGCVFEGWADKDGKIVSTQNSVSGLLIGDLFIKAVFKDITPPSAEISIRALEKPEAGEGSEDFLYSNRGIELNVNGEDLESGVDSIKYQIVKAGEIYNRDKGWMEYLDQVVLEEDIHATAYARVKDRHGNITIVKTKPFLVDQKGCSLELTPNFTSGEWTRREDAAIGVNVIEGKSPLRRVTYIVDGVARVRENEKFLIGDLKDGAYDVEVIAEDKAGNQVDDTIQVKKETVDTTIQVTGNPKELAREATLTAEVTTGVSGLKEITVNGEKIEGNTWKLGENDNGDYVFEATSIGGSTASVTVHVTNMVISVKEIQVEEPEISLAVGKTHQIRWKVLPEDATYQDVVFTSSKEECVTVDETGLITSLKEGDAEITAVSADNPSVSAKIRMDLFEEYRLHASVDEGGKIQYNGETLATSEESGKAEADIYLRKGTEYTLMAVPLKGYEFTGWKNEKGELVQKEAAISSKLMKDVSLYAEFRDNVAPEGEIRLKELENPENVEITAHLTGKREAETCAYSSSGFEVTIVSSDVPSGVASVHYQVLTSDKDLDPEKGWLTYEKPFTLEEDSDVIVYARIEDKDQNLTIAKSKEIVIDHEGIRVEAAPNFTPGEWNHTDNNQIQVTVSENVTPVKSITYWIGSEEFISGEKEFTITGLKDGDYEVKVQTEDAAGNVVQAVIPVKQDTGKPEIEVLGNPDHLVRDAVLEIKTNPGISGLKEITVNDRVVEGDRYAVHENGIYVIRAANQAGTVSELQAEVTNIIVPVREIQADQVRDLILGERWQLVWKVQPENADYPQVNFQSSDESVAAVSDEGLITAEKSGRAMITITAKDDPKITKTVSIQVKLPEIKPKAVSDQNIRITWRGAAGAKEYWIYRSSKADGTYKKIGRAKESFYIDKKVKKGKSYYYKVQAIGKDKALDGTLGTAVKGKACLMTPDHVKVRISGRNYKVKWEKVKGARSYTIYRSAKANGPFKMIGTGRGSSFTDKTSGIKKKWYYKVKAIGVRSRQNSSLSKGVYYKKPVAELKKAKALLKNQSGEITVGWKAVKGATHYQIYRAESRWGIYVKLGEAEKRQHWEDKTVEKGKKYYYKIRAVKKEGKKVKMKGNTSEIVSMKSK